MKSRALAQNLRVFANLCAKTNDKCFADMFASAADMIDEQADELERGREPVAEMIDEMAREYRHAAPVVAVTFSIAARAVRRGKALTSHEVLEIMRPHLEREKRRAHQTRSAPLVPESPSISSAL